MDHVAYTNISMRSLQWAMIALTGLFFFSACRQAAGPATVPGMTPSVATETAEPTASPTVIPQTATPTMAPALATPVATSTPGSPAEGSANADVIYVRAVQTADKTWTFHVTVEHPDTGWEDYADGWDVLTPDGTIIKPNPGDPFTRLLLHPHVGEQPFTRSQSDIVIPENVTRVTVRAHDLVDGYGGRQILVDLTVESSSDFRIESQTK